MIVIKDNCLDTQKKVDIFLDYLLKSCYSPADRKFVEKVYIDYVNECFVADAMLQKLVSEKLSNDFIVFTFLPLSDTVDLDSFSFSLFSENEEKVFKRSDEIVFKELCDRCFGGIKGLRTRAFEVI